MLMRLVCVGFIFCVINKVNSSPTFGLLQGDSNSEGSIIGNILRRKAQFLDDLTQNFHKKLDVGNQAFTNNLNNFRSSVSSTLDATAKLIDDGKVAGKQFGKTIFLGLTMVPKTIEDLILVHVKKDFLKSDVALKLSYVQGQPKYIFQYITYSGKIIPITVELATKLVPNIINDE